MVEGVFAGGFAIFGVQNVVNWLVKRGGVVVKVWLETTAKSFAKNMPPFCTFFRFFCNDSHCDATMVLVTVESAHTGHRWPMLRETICDE